MRSSRRLPPDVVSALLRHGHAGEVGRLAADGDWHCARALAADLAEQGRPAAAAELLRPFAEGGRWAAVDALAGVLDAAGRTGEAIDLVRRHAMAGGRLTGPRLAELLARQGRTDEVMALLGPHAADPWYAGTLVRLTAGAGHDDELATLLRARPGRGHDRWDAETLLATVLARQGHVDEALRLLGPDAGRAADLLARHGLEARLRDLVARTGDVDAACRLAAWLEEQDRVDDAVDALRAAEAVELFLGPAATEAAAAQETAEAAAGSAQDAAFWRRFRQG